MEANASMSNIWNLNLPVTPWEVITRPGNDDGGGGGGGLCQMVRFEYLKRLRETLLDNLSKTAPLPPNFDADQYIDACMAEMEKDALRRCMMADIYREGMLEMINDVKICTEDSVTHASLRPAVDLARDAAMAVRSPVDSTAGDLDDVTGAETVTSTTDEADSVPTTASIVSPAERRRFDDTVSGAFDSQDEKRVLRLAVENYRRTGIRPGSSANAAAAAAGILRADRVANALLNPTLSSDMAKAYEFHRRMTELPPDSRARLDDELDRLLGRPKEDDAAAAAAAGLGPLTVAEQRAVSRKRIARMVVGSMDAYYADGRITKRMFAAMARLVSNNLCANSADVDEDTVRNIVDKLFSGCSADKVIVDFKDVSRLFQA